MNQTTWGAWYLVATSVKWSTDNSPDKICQDHDAHKQNLLDKIRVRELAIQTDPTKHDIANEKNGTDHTVIWQFVMKICLCYYIYSLDKELKKTANIDNLLISYWSRTKIHKPKSTFGFYQKMKLKITSKKKKKKKLEWKQSWNGASISFSCDMLSFFEKEKKNHTTSYFKNKKKKM